MLFLVNKKNFLFSKFFQNLFLVKNYRNFHIDKVKNFKDFINSYISYVRLKCRVSVSLIIFLNQQWSAQLIAQWSILTSLTVWISSAMFTVIVSETKLNWKSTKKDCRWESSPLYVDKSLQYLSLFFLT